MGEMVTARASKVFTMLLAWPDFEMPNSDYIAAFSSIVPDIGELAKFGIGLEEVRATLRRLD